MSTQKLTAGIVAWLLSRRDGQAEKDPATGRYNLAYGRPYRVLAVSLLIFAAGFLAFMMVAFRDDPDGFVPAAAVAGLFLAGALYLVYEVFFVRVACGDDGIHRKGITRAHVPWESVAKVSYSMGSHCFRFRGERGPTVRVSVYRNGLRTLAEFAHEGLHPSLAGDVADLLQKNPLNDVMRRCRFTRSAEAR